LGMVNCDTCLRLCHPGGRLHAEPIVIKHCLATLGCHACIKPDMVNGSWGLTIFHSAIWHAVALAIGSMSTRLMLQPAPSALPADS
jgi:hypothetical protein